MDQRVRRNEAGYHGRVGDQHGHLAIIRAQAPRNDADRTTDVFAGQGGTTVMARAKKAPALVARTLAIEFHGHDLRRTAATRMAESGISREHIAFVLNHVQGRARATKVYDRYGRDTEKRVALETWERTLRRILARAQSTDVVPFTKRS